MSTLDMIGTVLRMSRTVQEQLGPKLIAAAGADPDVDLPREWTFMEHIPWEVAYALPTGSHSIFIHCSFRGLRMDMASGTFRAGGPDLAVGFLIRYHRERASANQKLSVYIGQALWSIITESGYHPHFNSITSGGRPESTDWYNAGHIICGPVDGAPPDNEPWGAA